MHQPSNPETHESPQLRRKTHPDPLSRQTANEMTLSPGVFSEVYRLQRNIEKAFDQQEQKLDEGKASATSDTAKEIQAIAITHIFGSHASLPDRKPQSD